MYTEIPRPIFQAAGVVGGSVIFHGLARRAGTRYVRTATEEDEEKGPFGGKRFLAP